jgi:hypothetical protein
VPLDQYRGNLAHILEVFEVQGVPVVLITAPTSHYRLGVPDYLVELRFVEDKAAAVSLHRAYNQAVREVAQGAAEGVFLLDLEAAFEDLDDETLAEVFTEDGIHLTAQGKTLVGGLVAAFVRQVTPPVSSGRLGAQAQPGL